MCKELFKKNDKGELEAPICCICLTQMEINENVNYLKCQHLFHTTCLGKWIERKNTCPYCRKKVEFAKFKKKIINTDDEDKIYKMNFIQKHKNGHTFKIFNVNSCIFLTFRTYYIF